MITINQVELATKLADREVRKEFDFDESARFNVDEDGNEYYTDVAQELFDEFYDEFYNMIKQCEEV